MVRVRLVELLQPIFFWFGIWYGLTIRFTIGLIVVPGFISVCSDGFSFIRLVVPLSEFSNLTKLWSFDGTYSRILRGARNVPAQLRWILAILGIHKIPITRTFKNIQNLHRRNNAVAHAYIWMFFFAFFRGELQRFLFLWRAPTKDRLLWRWSGLVFG